MNENIEVLDIANELVVIPKAVFDLFLSMDNPGELIALYGFYYYTSKWQKTNQPKCTTGFSAKGLHWKNSKVIRVKKQLIDIGLVKDIKQVDEKTHRVTGWYIRLGYIFKRNTIENQVKSHPIPVPEGGNSHPVDNGQTNALSSLSLNALSSNTSSDGVPSSPLQNSSKDNDNNKDSGREEKKDTPQKPARPPSTPKIKISKDILDKMDDKYLSISERHGVCYKDGKLPSTYYSARNAVLKKVQDSYTPEDILKAWEIFIEKESKIYFFPGSIDSCLRSKASKRIIGGVNENSKF
jgi:hypothetical protein